MSTQYVNDRAQNGNDILFNSTVQSVCRLLKRELDDGATIEEMREIVAGLLRYAESKMPQDDAQTRH